MTTETAKVWSGFWRRLGAWLVDGIVLAIVCCGFGWAAMDMVSAWGQNGRAFGLVLGTLYFGITASGLAGGRSVGMRALGLKVVHVSGKPLGLLPALGRALLLVAPLMINGWSFTLPAQIPVEVINGVAMVAVFGILPAQIYLLLFNAPARRMLHDMVFGAVVVRAEAGKPDMPKGRVHAIIASLIILVALGLTIGAPYLLQRYLPASTTQTFSEQQKVMDAVNALPEVAETGVMDNTNTLYRNNQPPQVTRTLEVTVRVGAWPADVNKTMTRVGATTVKAYKFAPDQKLMVKVVRGFDLGFGSYSNAQSAYVSTTCTAAEADCVLK